MKKTIELLAAAAMVGGMLLLPFAAGAQGQAAPAKTAVKARHASQKLYAFERHPHIRRALKDLHHAYFVLNHKAAHDFHGYRVKAMQEIVQAIQDLKLALQADRGH